MASERGNAVADNVSAVNKELDINTESNGHTPRTTTTTSATGIASTSKSKSPASATGATCRNLASAKKKIKPDTGTENDDETYAEVCQYFFEDEVFKIDRKGRVKFGVVTDTYTDGYSDDEDEDVDDMLSKGEVRVSYYPDGKELVQTESMLGLADRTLLPGDIVRRIVPGKKCTSGQRGYVREVNMCVDCRILGTKYIIKNVACERLRTLSLWTVDLAVCFDSWVGSTTNVEEKAILKLTNGARVEIGSNDFYRFKDLTHSSSARSEYSANCFYPGNMIVGRLPTLERCKNLTPEISLPTNKKGRSIINRFTVESVYTESVSVMWQCRALSQDAQTDYESLRQPPETLTGEQLNQLKRLNLFESCMLQIHDRSYLKYSKCDKVIKLSEWEEEKSRTFQELVKQQKPLRNKNAKPIPAESEVQKTQSNAKFSLRRFMPRSSATSNQSNGELSVDTMPQVASITSKSILSKASVANTHSSVDTEDHNENVSCETSTNVSLPRLNPRTSKRRHVKKKMRSFRKSLTATFTKDTEPKDGDELVVEAVLVYSTITVVWQDGTIESGVPSVHLFPIHHLDNHEFFPGDFVCTDLEENKLISQRDYGIVQHVDHDGRTGIVKWFSTYLNTDKPTPTFNGQTEVSVYDLKDHPDFQYRPGTMVIRVANFVGEDAGSTAGQIIDNFTDGRIKVWWVNGHITMCYPQDLFEVSQFDPDDDYEDDSDDSWETESEKSTFGSDDSAASMEREVHILAGIDGAKDAIQRLQCIIRLTNDAQKSEIVKDLLAVYKNCRFLDRLLHTSFFHEDHFQGIVRRKKVKSEPKTSESTTKESSSTPVKASTTLFTFNLCGGAVKPRSTEFAPKLVFNMGSRPLCNAAILNGVHAGPSNSMDVTSPNNPVKRKSSSDISCREIQKKRYNDSTAIANGEEVAAANILDAKKSEKEVNLTDEELLVKYKNEYVDILNLAKANITKAFEKSHKHKISKNDSGNYSRTESSDETANSESNETKITLSVPVEHLKSHSNTSIELSQDSTADVCEIFCFLINEQMEKCRELIEQRYCKIKKREQKDDENAMDAFDVSSEKSDASSVASGDGIEVIKEPKALELLSINVEEHTRDSSPLPETQEPESPMACSSPSKLEMRPSTPADENCFEFLSKAPATHRFIQNQVQPVNHQQYYRAVQREYKLLRTSLPPGVKVRAYENRLDLLSVMMEGPSNTPYEDAVFFFDLQMGREYPKAPPACHYISYCSDRLNPNLYEDGKVCVSLLGTWNGRDTEVWGTDSTLLQVLVSIQGLILVDEPYYNEAGYEKQKGSQHGQENSRMYNEMTLIKVLQSTIKQLQNPPTVFHTELLEHFKVHGNPMYERITRWVDVSNEAQNMKITQPENLPQEMLVKCKCPIYPFLPCSRGCCIALTNALQSLKSNLQKIESELSKISIAKDVEADDDDNDDNDVTKLKQRPIVA